MTMTPEFNRRVVYVGVSRMSTNREIQRQAFQFWQQTLAKQAFDVRNIVFELEQFLGLNTGEKKALYIALQAAMTKLESQLPPVPAFIDGIEPSTQATSASANSRSTSPQHQITQAMLNAMASGLHGIDRGLHVELGDILAEEGLSAVDVGSNAAVSRWGDNALETLNLPETISVEQCQTLFHQFYLLLTEVAGPINADKLVDIGINTCKSVRAAEQFSPEQLL